MSICFACTNFEPLIQAAQTASNCPTLLYTLSSKLEMNSWHELLVTANFSPGLKSDIFRQNLIIVWVNTRYNLYSTVFRESTRKSTLHF